MRLAHKLAVVVTDPYLVADVLGKETEIEKSIEGVYSKFNVLLHPQGKPNIFTSHTDEYWKLVRKGVAPAFSPKNIRKGFGHVVQVNRQLISILEAKQGAPVDLDNATLRVTLDVIGRVGFGKDFGATRDLSDGRANLDMMAAGRDEGIKRISNPLRQYLQFLQSVKKGEEDFRTFRKMMADLLRCFSSAGQPLPDDRIAAEIGVFFTGGFETTGHTIAWALFMITQHPEVEAKVVAELASLGLMATIDQPTPRAMEYDDIAKLTYTANAIKESMRMLPVLADGTNRTTLRDTWLGPHLIPRGTMVWVPLKATFNSPHLWHGPDQYIPERWEEPGAEYALPPGTDPAAVKELGVQAVQVRADAAAAKDTSAKGETEARAKRFLPFSAGTRDCVGQSLARMNYTTTVAMLLAHFKFELTPEMGGYEGVLRSQSCALTTLQPENGLWCTAVPRVRSLRSTSSEVLPQLPHDILATLPEHPDETRTMDAPRLPMSSASRQRSGSLPVHLVLARHDIKRPSPIAPAK
ncbi:Cytochrome P450 3A28 [Coccomyxa sp. Obi]|nr:Cytochrome P450 3A28 [Coccomyxa sp. Obi]